MPADPVPAVHHLPSQFELVGNFTCDVLKCYGRARNPLEAHTIEGQPGQFAHLHLPLDEVVLSCVTVDAEQEEALALFIVAAVSVQHFADLPHHVGWLHGGGGLHAPGEAKGTGLGVTAAFVFGVA